MTYIYDNLKMQISLKPTINHGYTGMTVFYKFTYIYNKMNFTYCIFFTPQKSSPVLSLRYFWSQTYYSSRLQPFVIVVFLFFLNNYCHKVWPNQILYISLQSIN